MARSDMLPTWLPLVSRSSLVGRAVLIHEPHASERRRMQINQPPAKSQPKRTKEPDLDNLD